MGLRGLLPPSVQTMEQQLKRVEHQISTKSTSFQKHIALANLRQRNERLFYAYILKNMRSTLPLVYTPVVGEACQKFSHMFRRPEGLTLTIEDKGSVAECVSNWPRPQDVPRIAVITDGSRILGLGELGWNGLGISIGKLSLYVAGAGVHPQSTMPIVIDVGTTTKSTARTPCTLACAASVPALRSWPSLWTRSCMSCTRSTPTSSSSLKTGAVSTLSFSLIGTRTSTRCSTTIFRVCLLYTSDAADE